MINLLSETGMGSWLMPVMLIGLFAIMLIVTIIPQKKRKKQAQQMMSTLGVGSQVRTIGGFVGIVFAIDDSTNIIQLNIGSEESPVLVTLDKAAIYTVINSGIEETPVVTEAGAVVSEDSIVSLDDADEAARIADKKADKAAKKAAKASKNDVVELQPNDDAVNDIFDNDVTESNDEVSL